MQNLSIPLPVAHKVACYTCHQPTYLLATKKKHKKQGPYRNSLYKKKHLKKFLKSRQETASKEKTCRRSNTDPPSPPQPPSFSSSSFYQYNFSFEQKRIHIILVTITFTRYTITKLTSSFVCICFLRHLLFSK